MRLQLQELCNLNIQFYNITFRGSLQQQQKLQQQQHTTRAIEMAFIFKIILFCQITNKNFIASMLPSLQTMQMESLDRNS